MISPNESSISGLIFLIEITSFFLLDENLEICVVEGKEEEISKFKENNTYKIDNLEKLGLDQRHYYKYRIKENVTKFDNSDTMKNKNYAIIKLIALDAIQSNANPILQINNKSFKIAEKVQFIPVEIEDESTYTLIPFELSIHGINKTYNFFIYKREINIIYLGLKNDSIKANKSYEIIYLSKDPKFLPKEIRVSDYLIKECDKFSCENRIRFNVINVKKDKQLYCFNDDVTSYEIIYLINEKNEINKYGVFNISSCKKVELNNYIIKQNSDKLQKFYDNYKRNSYTDADDIYKYYNDQTNLLNIDENEKKLFFDEGNINLCLYKKESLNQNNVYEYFRNLFFFLFFSIIKKNSKYRKFNEYFDFLDKIKGYDNYTKIKLLSGFINMVKNYNIIPSFVDIKHLKDDNPYYLAMQLQKDIISNFTEKSNIFYPILQFNSKILEILPDNYIDVTRVKIKKLLSNNNTPNYAYTISLENIESMKNHLKSVEEDFFFVLKEKNECYFYGLYNVYSQTTTLNEYYICEDLDIYREPEEKKGCAFSINMVLSHERMCQGKESLNNQGINSPYTFFNIDFKKDYIYSHDSKKSRGRMFERFIANYLLIDLMKRNKNFFKYLDYKYFIGNFEELKKYATKIIKDDYSYKAMRSRGLNRIILEFSIYILIISMLFGLDKLYFNKCVKYSLILFISFLFLFYFYKDYRKFSDPLCDNESYYDIIIERKNNDVQDSRIYLYPDDYPIESETFLGRYFPFLEFRKNKIRKILSKYLDSKDGNCY